MGFARPHFRRHVDVAVHFARSDAGRISCRVLKHQHHYATDAVLPASRGLLPALREEHGYRYRHGNDAAVLDVVPAHVDDLPAAIFCDRLTAWHPGKLHLPRISMRTSL